MLMQSPPLHDVQVAIRALGFDVKKADVQKIMRDCDKDNTGKISLADFTEISKPISSLFRTLLILSQSSPMGWYSVSSLRSRPSTFTCTSRCVSNFAGVERVSKCSTLAKCNVTRT